MNGKGNEREPAARRAAWSGIASALAGMIRVQRKRAYMHAYMHACRGDVARRIALEGLSCARLSSRYFVGDKQQAYTGRG